MFNISIVRNNTGDISLKILIFFSIKKIFMENKQKNANILNFISLAVLIINMIYCYASVKANYFPHLSLLMAVIIFTGLYIIALIFFNNISLFKIKANSWLDVIRNQSHISFIALCYCSNYKIF